MIIVVLDAVMLDLPRRKPTAHETRSAAKCLRSGRARERALVDVGAPFALLQPLKTLERVSLLLGPFLGLQANVIA